MKKPSQVIGKKSGGIKNPYNLGWGYEKPSKFESEVYRPVHTQNVDQ